MWDRFSLLGIGEEKSQYRKASTLRKSRRMYEDKIVTEFTECLKPLYSCRKRKGNVPGRQ